MSPRRDSHKRFAQRIIDRRGPGKRAVRKQKRQPRVRYEAKPRADDA